MDLDEMERMLAAPGKALHDSIFGRGKKKKNKIVQVCTSDPIFQDDPSVILHPYAEYMIRADKIVVNVLDVELTFPKAVFCKYYARAVVADVSVPRVCLPPSRRLNISGQTKIAIDVSLLLQYLKKSDIVDVVGSGSSIFGGNSYLLLAGVVAQVNLYDPFNCRDNCILEGTHFNYHRRIFSDLDIVGDVLINDAFDTDFGLPVYVNVAPYRVYSVKYFDPAIEKYPGPNKFFYDFVEVDEWPVGEYERHDNCRGKSILFDKKNKEMLQYNIRPSFIYGQIGSTKCEVRRVYPARPWSISQVRLGSCPACIEFAHRGNYIFSDFQLKVWKAMHSYLSCSLSGIRTSFVEYNYINFLLLKTSDYPMNIVDVSYDSTEIKTEQQLYVENVVGVRIGNVHLDEESLLKVDSLKNVLSKIAPVESQYLVNCPVSFKIPEEERGKLFIYTDYGMVIGNEVYRIFHIGKQFSHKLKFLNQSKDIMFGTKVRLKGRACVKTFTFVEFSNFVLQRLSFC